MNGVLLINKPIGITSHDVISKLRSSWLKGLVMEL